MAKKGKQHSKHIPQRTCVGCREVLPKRSLTRVVKSPEGVQVDLTGKAHGRGAYLHDQQACWQRGIKSALEQALQTKLTEQEKEGLAAFMEENIPVESPNQQEAEGLSG